MSLRKINKNSVKYPNKNWNFVLKNLDQNGTQNHHSLNRSKKIKISWQAINNYYYKKPKNWILMT